MQAKLRNLLFVLLLAFLGWQYLQPRFDTADPDTNRALLRAAENRQSDVWLEAGGIVIRRLPDDNEGSRHQKFLLRISPDLTVLVAHNIDLAPRVPLAKGDRIRLRGEYEWNRKGGVIHWTHHDPRGRKAGGWIELDGQRYR